jgi:ATPase family protein associated with various cellular activities (AAA)
MIKKNKQYLSPDLMEEQESLSPDRLKKLYDTCRVVPNKPRPPANFIDMMNWAMEEFGPSLKDQFHLNKFVHNRIIIDGQFLQFCEERGIKITALFRDSTISWKTERKFEKFFAQGVFLINFKDLEFLHAAVFTKGSAYEDEISFFIIVSENNYQGYLNFRNEFDEWVSDRDRDNLHVRVVEGEDIPYTKDQTWDDLFLPKNIKTEIQSLVENFLSSKDFYLENHIAWKRGLLLYGPAGNGKSSLIKTIISMYPFKPVTIVPGSNDDAVREAFSYAEQQSPSLLYFEDLDSLLERTMDLSSFLNLMDGISTKNGLLVIATCNNIKKLQANITDRPSRFDRKFEIPRPNIEMAHIYLKRWFNKMITDNKCKELARLGVKRDFSYVHYKELFISSMFEALAHNRRAPLNKDIDVAMNKLIKDKNSINNGVINTDKYFQ